MGLRKLPNEFDGMTVAGVQIYHRKNTYENRRYWHTYLAVRSLLVNLSARNMSLAEANGNVAVYVRLLAEPLI